MEAAPGLYAVSASFLEKLPGAIRAGAEALEDGGVKRWLGEVCASGELTCFSYLEKMRSADEAALGATRIASYGRPVLSQSHLPPRTVMRQSSWASGAAPYAARASRS